jgi:ABC-type branched-subunit amino acid transport system ATPase component
MTAIRVRAVHAGYGEKTLVRNVSVDVPDGS